MENDTMPILIPQLLLTIVALLILLFSVFIMNSFAAIHGNCNIRFTLHRYIFEMLRSNQMAKCCFLCLLEMSTRKVENEKNKVFQFGFVHSCIQVLTFWFFLLITCIGQFLIILCQMVKVAFWMTINSDSRSYMSTFLIFRMAQPLNDIGGFLVDINNLLIVIERTIASTKLDRYESSRANWTALLACEAFSVCVALAFAYLIHYQRKVVESASAIVALGIVTIIVLIFCHLYSAHRYKRLVGVNEKYQMREVEYLTRALIPACIVNALLRMFSNAMAIFLTGFFTSYVQFMSTFHSILTINAAQWGMLVIALHQGMRARARSLLLAFIGRRQQSFTAKIGEANLRKDNTKDYFDYLRSSWK